MSKPLNWTRAERERRAKDYVIRNYRPQGRGGPPAKAAKIEPDIAAAILAVERRKRGLS